MEIKAILNFLETIAPPALQESYDNSGLMTGDASAQCSGVLCCLDVTEQVLEEAEAKGCNLVVAHHPLIFKGLKQITPNTAVGRCVIQAIRKDICVYAIHTNLDKVISGVNGRMADLLELERRSVLQPAPSTLAKLVTYIPLAHLGKVQEALFDAGAGQVGRYGECSYFSEGTGTFKGAEGTDPFVGKPGERHEEREYRLEVLFPLTIKSTLVSALLEAHPYEEPAYDLIPLVNDNPLIGAGMIGFLPGPMEEKQLLDLVKERFGAKAVKHTAWLGRPVQKIAVCGGSGSFLISSALNIGADVFITSDIRYHDFFLADGKMLLVDIGHYETEQFTIDLLYEILGEKFRNFAVLKTGLNTNPVHYF